MEALVTYLILVSMLHLASAEDKFNESFSWKDASLGTERSPGSSHGEGSPIHWSPPPPSQPTKLTPRNATNTSAARLTPSPTPSSHAAKTHRVIVEGTVLCWMHNKELTVQAAAVGLWCPLGIKSRNETSDDGRYQLELQVGNLWKDFPLLCRVFVFQFSLPRICNIPTAAIVNYAPRPTSDESVFRVPAFIYRSAE